jgi:predicted MFS family arabinose efflux permease
VNQPLPPAPFTAHQKAVVFLLALTQFTVILDFMIMSPLGDMLMKSLHLKPAHFGIAVSAYAFSAGISGILTAGFADRFDRKKLLLFFYTGFILGTVLCGLANSFPLLVAARIITGLFGGVIGSVAMAIITDLFTLQQRGRVMGFVQMGFGASQVLGVPIGLYIANALGWEATFFMVAVLALLVGVGISLRLQPITAHLALQKAESPLAHLAHTVANRSYRIGFAATALLSIGGFMMMPFGSAFAVNNLKITPEQLPLLFLTSGLSSLVVMPLVGRFSDRIDKFTLFVVATCWMMVMTLTYTHLSVTPLWEVLLFNVAFMVGIMSRMIPAGALTSALPDPRDRGAYMSINASLQQVAGGVAAAFAGWIVVQKTPSSPLEHYGTLGFVIVGV